MHLMVNTVLVSVQMCPVLAGPGLLDVWEHPCVCGGHDGPGGLHHPQVLHPAGEILPVTSYLEEAYYPRGRCRTLKLPYSKKFTETVPSSPANQ